MIASKTEMCTKIERKKKRYIARLKKSKMISFTCEITTNIIICNAGQATGLSKDAISKVISELGLSMKVPKYKAEKGETFSFLIFEDINSAKMFYETFQGKNVNGSTVCLSFVESVPINEIECPNDNPNGLHLIENFVSEDEEKAFICLFDFHEKSNSLKNRQVKHYGYEFRYGTNDVNLDVPLPEGLPKECDVLWERLKDFGLKCGKPDQLTVNKYEPGQGIPMHVDKHSPFGDTILSLSLSSAVVMDWKHVSGTYNALYVPPRSLLVMQGEARYNWQHGIQPRTYDPVIAIRKSGNKLVRVITEDTTARHIRISLTFRWVRKGPCSCVYRELCDSANNLLQEVDEEVAARLEDIHVHQVYEQIAGHFSTTRHTPWPVVEKFMADLPTGAIFMDFGCGNGKNIAKRNDILQICGERSLGLLKECGTRATSVPHAQCVALDVMRPGVRCGTCDAAVCIAVIHHMANEARRVQAIKNICDVLRPNGIVLITVWAKSQKNSHYLCESKDSEQTDEIVSIDGVSLPIHVNRTQFKHKDLLVPWKLRKKNGEKLADKPDSTLLRYYHMFEEGELDDLCSRVDGIFVEKSFYEDGNWCVICKKL